MVDIQTIRDDGYTVLKIQGEVDASSSIQLDEALAELIAAQPPAILVDCTGLQYISSAGLGVFMSYIEELDSKQIKMVLFGLSDKVRHVFDILGLDQLLQLVDSQEEAKALLT